MLEVSLVRVCDFLERLNFFDYEPVAESLSWLGQIHSRGWLYTSSRGEEILAVAAAFRVREWNDDYFRRLPGREEGTRLYIAFFSSDSKSPSAALKLLREYLRDHPDITEIIYHRKKGWSGIGPLKRFSRARVMARVFGNADGRLSAKSGRMMIQPPSLISAREKPAGYRPLSLQEEHIHQVSERLLESAGKIPSNY